ncbi:MAG: arginase family protein [Hyphomicrobiaceae bacterium]
MNTLILLFLAFSSFLAPSAVAQDGIPDDWAPWRDPKNPNVIVLDKNDPSKNVWNLRRDTSKDAKREPGLVNVQRYAAGFSSMGAFPTFLAAPMAFSPKDLKAGGVEVAIVGLNIDDNLIAGGRYAANQLRALTDVTGFGGPAYDPHMHLDYIKSLVIADYGNVASHYGHSERSIEEVHKVISEILSADAMPLAMGGSHLQMYPMITALAKKYGTKSFAIVHVDAHYDAMTIGFGRYVHNGRMISQAVERGIINGSDIIQVALRSASPGTDDLKWMQKNGLRFHYYSEIRNKGFKAVMQRVLDEVKGKKLFISFDMDGIDPAYAAAVGTQEPEGLTASDAMQLMRALGIQNELVAVEINEWNPLLDDKHQTTGILMDRLMRSVLAGIAARKKGIKDPFYVAPTGLDYKK